MTAPASSFVVDASVAIKLSLPEALSDRAEMLFAQLAGDPPARLFVPDLFYIESANVFWKAVRRGDLTEAEAALEAAALHQLALQVVSTRDLMTEALKLAVRHNITAYGASYVALSDREAITLISDDQLLIQKLAGTSHRIQWLGDFNRVSTRPT